MCIVNPPLIHNPLLFRVNTILGSAALSLSVKLKQAFSSGSKDASIIESQQIKICIMLCFFFRLDLAGETTLSLSANHLQKLRLSFQLTTPLGHLFKPLQAFLKLKHETKVEHIFVLGNSGEQFEITLDFLGLVEKFFYLSGRTIQKI
ncbi:hypothetical protein ACSBR1_041621 [Camellia fascicularis]